MKMVEELSAADGWVRWGWLCHKERPGAVLEGAMSCPWPNRSGCFPVSEWPWAGSGPAHCCLHCACHPVSSAFGELGPCSAGGIKRKSWSPVPGEVAKGDHVPFLKARSILLSFLHWTERLWLFFNTPSKSWVGPELKKKVCSTGEKSEINRMYLRQTHWLGRCFQLHGLGLAGFSRWHLRAGVWPCSAVKMSLYPQLIFVKE